MTRRRSLLRLFRALGRRQITKAIEDPELRRKVTPTDEMGCKRIMLTDDWYPTLAKPDVDVVVDPVVEVGPGGIRTADGTERPADVLVLATGFRTHGFVAPMEVVGDGGRQLAEEWGQVPRAYLGLSVPGFPNLFLLYGPNTNGGTGSVIYTIEAGVRHVIAALRELERAHAQRIEVRRHAAEAFDRELRAALSGTVWHTGLHELVRRRARQRPEPVAVAVDHLPPPDGPARGRRVRDVRARRLARHAVTASATIRRSPGAAFVSSAGPHPAGRVLRRWRRRALERRTARSWAWTSAGPSPTPSSSPRGGSSPRRSRPRRRTRARPSWPRCSRRSGARGSSRPTWPASAMA